MRDAATPGEWEWWNGCSWWRLGVRGTDKTVLRPSVDHDGQPNLDSHKWDRLAAAPAAVTLAEEFAKALAEELRREYLTHGEGCGCNACALLDRHLPNWRDHARD